MKKQLLWITCILALAACEKDIAPSNPATARPDSYRDFRVVI
jgi:hypothetical protein